MLTKKYAIVSFVIALLVLIGFTMKNPENMVLSAAFLNPNTNGPVTAANIQLTGQDSGEVHADTQVTQQRVDAVTKKEIAVESAEPLAAPKAEVSKSGLEAAPAKSSTSTTKSALASRAAAPAPTSKVNPVSEVPVTGSEAQQTPSASSAPSSTPTPDLTQDGDDPVPNAKKVNLSAAEIAKVVEQFEQLETSNQEEPSWKRKADHLIVKGLGFLGTPYVFGAKTGQTDTFDCSSYLKYIFLSQGVSLPRDSRQQSQRGTSVSIDQLREGDLVFFTTPKRKNKVGIERIGHVAVYLGNGLILHTFRPGIGVTISELNGPWKERFAQAKRVL
jgi:cell wall-associated NlpC family hydrolase